MFCFKQVPMDGGAYRALNLHALGTRSQICNFVKPFVGAPRNQITRFSGPWV